MSKKNSKSIPANETAIVVNSEHLFYILALELFLML